jgi:nitroimidazol reductase NimA-like FMN-containing flavoprotein (pyridoxamine 5'-phosphate oxidase superfamily)
MSSSYLTTDRTRINRLPKRAAYEKKVVHGILDASLLCTVAVVVDGLPRNIPTAFVRLGEAIYIHGSNASQLLKALAAGAPACISVSIIDGIVAARSGFNCAVDYRSVVIFSTAEEVADQQEKEKIFDLFIQHLIPGHSVRPPHRNELNATTILRFPLAEVSAKVRDAGVNDFDEDLVLTGWAGTIPLRTVALAPKSCSKLKPGIEVPPYATGFDGWKSVSPDDVSGGE